MKSGKKSSQTPVSGKFLMKDHRDNRLETHEPTVEFNPLLLVCELLNKHQVRYIIAGAFACILHGLVRTTEDVDILISPEPENCRKVIDALKELPDQVANELTEEDLLENVVVKVVDAVEVDVSKSAWSVTYQEAIDNAKEILLDEVKIPFLSLPDLIKSKDTYREKDQLDLISLKELLRRKTKPGP